MSRPGGHDEETGTTGHRRRAALAAAAAGFGLFAAVQGTAAATATTPVQAVADTHGHAAAKDPRPHAHRRSAPVRPRTVVRCQSDDTDETQDFGDDDGDEPTLVTTPWAPSSSSHCGPTGLGIARVLGGAGPRNTARR